jgi:primosomal protein N''
MAEYKATLSGEDVSEIQQALMVREDYLRAALDELKGTYPQAEKAIAAMEEKLTRTRGAMVRLENALRLAKEPEGA